MLVRFSSINSPRIVGSSLLWSPGLSFILTISLLPCSSSSFTLSHSASLSLSLVSLISGPVVVLHLRRNNAFEVMHSLYPQLDDIYYTHTPYLAMRDKQLLLPEDPLLERTLCVIKPGYTQEEFSTSAFFPLPFPLCYFIFVSFRHFFYADCLILSLILIFLVCFLLPPIDLVMNTISENNFVILGKVSRSLTPDVAAALVGKDSPEGIQYMTR